ncbi:MAG: cupin domain-containing protein [Chitinophagaceae bacterium]|nr:cupin domain-containing protein [Chitinophagaceae bacterium]
MTHKVALAEAINQLNKETEFPFTQLLRHGSMTVEYFAPQGTDTQQPHLQDEIYVIASGSSAFFCNGNYMDCTKGDLLFVPAGMEHHFEHFTDDFATWVIFYGPRGGEKEI